MARGGTEVAPAMIGQPSHGVRGQGQPAHGHSSRISTASDDVADVIHTACARGPCRWTDDPPGEEEPEVRLAAAARGRPVTSPSNSPKAASVMIEMKLPTTKKAEMPPRNVGPDAPW